MTRIAPATRKLAHSLAVEYCAYLEAVQQGDSLGIRCWGRMLLNTQEALGVEVAFNHTIRALIAKHTLAAPSDPAIDAFRAKFERIDSNI